MGEPLNGSGDLIPAEALYEACRVMARHVRHLGGLRWDFSALHTMPIDPAFTKLVECYLSSVLSLEAPRKGWKLPETTLIFPWIVRLFPDIHYIYWIRDPRDCIIGGHKTDDLADFGVPYTPTDDLRQRRAISWKYQVEIVKATHAERIRLERLRKPFGVLPGRTVLRLVDNPCRHRSLLKSAQLRLTRETVPSRPRNAHARGPVDVRPSRAATADRTPPCTVARRSSNRRRYPGMLRDRIAL